MHILHIGLKLHFVGSQICTFINRFRHRLFCLFFLFGGNVLVRFTVSSMCSSVWIIQEFKWYFADSTVGIYCHTLRQFQNDFDSRICQRTLKLGTA